MSRLEVKKQNYKKQNKNKKTKIYEKKQNKKTPHLLLRILAVIGRYGSHLMIVMIFVTQNNF